MDNFKDITISQFIRALQDAQPSGIDPIVRFYDTTGDQCNMSFFIRAVAFSQPINGKNTPEFMITLGKINNADLT